MERTIIEGDFEWGVTKNNNNIKRHQMELKVGVPVFDDEYKMVYIDNRDHHDEIRYITIGLNVQMGLLFVVFSERESKNRTRLISVREATKSEKQAYRKRL